MKKFLFLLLAVSIFFSTMIMPVSAGAPFSGDSIESFFSGNSLDTFKCGNPVITDESNEALEDYKENDANMAEKFLTSQAQNFFHIGDINGISTLVFGNPYCVWKSDWKSDATMASNGIFTDEEMNKIIKPMVKMLGSLFIIVMTIAFLFSGLKIMASSVRGHAMANFWEDAGMWAFALLLALFYYEFIDLLFQINAAFVLSIRDLILSMNPDALDGFSVMSSLTDFLNAGFMGSFLLVIAAEWVLAAVLNIIYIARIVVIILLIFMGVIAIYSLMFAKTRGFFMNWIRELVGNIFLQSIHALVFFAIIQFVALGAGVFFKLVLMMMFIPVSGMLSKWLNFGDSSSKLGNTLTMMGLGGAVSSIMLAQQASNIVRGGSFNAGGSVLNGGFGGANTFGGPGGGGPGGGGLTQLANSSANDMAATSIAMRAQGTSDSTLFNLSKNAGGKLGSFVGGGGGMVLGPAGVAAGMKIGGAIGEGIPQMGRNLAVASQGVFQNLSSMKNFESASGETGVKALFGKGESGNSFETVNARRQLMANVGESMGLAVGGQKGAQLGRSLGGALSGVSRQRLNEANATQLASSLGMGNVNGALSFSQLAEKFPNAEAKWVQTNQGSSFHVNTGDGFKQVGVTGSADGTLSDGQARVMDFKLADPALDYSIQSNGTYKPDKDLFESSMNSLNNVAEADSSNLNSFSEAMSGGSVQSDSNLSFTNMNTMSSVEGGSDAIKSFDETIADGAVNTGDNLAFTSMSSVGDTSSTSENISGGSSESVSTPAAIGLQGSTPNVMRTSDAYIVSGIDSSNASNVAEISTQKEVSKVQDSSFQSKNVNPDAYIFQGVKGSKVSTSDRVADNLQTTGKVASHWQQKLQEKKQSRKERKRDVI